MKDWIIVIIIAGALLLGVVEPFVRGILQPETDGAQEAMTALVD